MFDELLGQMLGRLTTYVVRLPTNVGLNVMAHCIANIVLFLLAVNDKRISKEIDAKAMNMLHIVSNS